MLQVRPTPARNIPSLGEFTSFFVRERRPAFLVAEPENTPQSFATLAITAQGHCNTAVALDVNGDQDLDVIASFNGRVRLFLAPDWKTEVILYRFVGGGCIHSAVIDADGDGDLDWVRTLASAHPFWLENPGGDEAPKGAWTPRMIDNEITGIHCILAAAPTGSRTTINPPIARMSVRMRTTSIVVIANSIHRMLARSGQELSTHAASSG